MNCAYNAISALSRARYGHLVADAGSIEVVKRGHRGRRGGQRGWSSLGRGWMIAAVVELGRRYRKPFLQPRRILLRKTHRN